ncbi:MAG TPA: hypothetical protein VJ964_08190 [Balneolaceae bacterium]|nr:hypothetical protein [Balneolaceae bacterium]
MLKHLLFIALLCGGAYYYWTTRPVTHGPGVVAPETPVQETTYNVDNKEYKGIEIIPKAKIKLEARVLSTKNYYFDTFSDLTPTDVVFGWGPMSNETNLDPIMVRQSDRSFYFEMTNAPIPQNKMWQHTANMHLILPTKEIKNKIESLRKGQIVRIKGLLVNAKSPDGWTLKTSLSRKDIGKDSSELVWINSVSIL